ncbi:hypothetical protein ACFLTP_04050 [Chloroflexota bacterium]
MLVTPYFGRDLGQGQAQKQAKHPGFDGLLPKQDVVGSNPITRSIRLNDNLPWLK